MFILLFILINIHLVKSTFCLTGTSFGNDPCDYCCEWEREEAGEWYVYRECVWTSDDCYNKPGHGYLVSVPKCPIYAKFAANSWPCNDEICCKSYASYTFGGPNFTVSCELSSVCHTMQEGEEFDMATWFKIDNSSYSLYCSILCSFYLCLSLLLFLFK